MEELRKLRAMEAHGEEDEDFGTCIAICKAKTVSNLIYALFFMALGIACFMVTLENRGELQSNIILIVLSLAFFAFAYVFIASMKKSVSIHEYGMIDRKGKKIRKRIAYEELGEVMLDRGRVISKGHTNTIHRWVLMNKFNEIIVVYDQADYVNLGRWMQIIGGEFNIFKQVVKNDKKDAVM